MEPTTHLRIARPSLDLAKAERFWVDGVGLSVLFRHDAVEGTAEHSLLMVGSVDAAWHLELTRNPDEPISPSPTPDDLLVLYLENDIPSDLLARLEACGGTRVAAHNPYWDTWGETVQDPDGYRLVLCRRSWSNRSQS
nr:VOC family protein [Haloglycomyces albus]